MTCPGIKVELSVLVSVKENYFVSNRFYDVTF
jgi:hypothetical protein